MPECPAAGERASTLIKGFVTITALASAIVNRTQITLLLIGAVAVPAVAYLAFAPKRDNLCFASGAATYRITPDAAAPDFRVKIADKAARPDLRMQLVDSPELADFVLVDDFSASEPAPCRSSTPIRTVTLDTSEVTPDVTVNLSADPGAADYKIYVHSMRYSQQDAAALLAAMWKADQRREAARFDGSKMTDRISPASTMVAITPAD